MHWPQLMQAISASFISQGLSMAVLKPRRTGANHAHLLDICAGAHAAAAQNALVVVADDGDGAGIRFILILGTGEAIAAFHAQIQAQLLQLAVLAAHTAEALLFVVAQNQLQIDAARLAHGRGVAF